MKRLVILGILSFLPARAQIVIGPHTLPAGQVNTPYSQQLTASGGTGPYTFARLSGSLPPGSPAFSLSSAGVISGTPDGCASFVANPNSPCRNATEPMNSTFTVLATDSLGAMGTQTYTIGIYWNPTEASFLTAFAGYDTNMVAGVNNPPPLLLGGHLGPANPLFRQPSTDDQSTWNAWVDGIHAAGATILDIETDLDCVFDNATSCLALYSGAINHARSLGMSISLDPEFYTWRSCGGAGCSPAGPSTGLAADCQALIGHTINASPGTGVSDWYACVTTRIPALGMSAYQWMISNWLANGDRFVPVHEPTTMAARWGEGVNSGGCGTATQPSQSGATCYGLTTTSPGGSGNTCPGDWWTNFLQPLLDPRTGLIPAWTTSAGISIRTGVTTIRSETAYTALFSNNLPASVDMGLDTYAFGPYDISEDESAISVAQQNQHQIFFEEFAPQRWVESGAPATEPCAIKGCYSCDWQTSQNDQNFVAAFLPFAASQGALSASLFPAQILAGCSASYPDNCENRAVLATASTSFLGGNRSALSQKLAALMTPGAGEPATITKSAGDGQSTPVGQAFPTALAVTVTDTTGTPVAGASATFTVTPGASGVFSSTGPVLITTDQNGNATAPVLTANSIPGQLTVTATVNALTATFTLANLGYTLGASSATVGSATGNSTVLLSGYGPWTATSNAPWLHLAAESGSGGGSALIQFSYDANANPAVQTGTLTIAGLLFTVTQAGASYVPVYPVAMLASSGFSLPQAVAVDAQGNVYIADTANNAVKQWNAANGQVTALASSGLNAPAGVAVDGQGNVYIADSGNNAIKQWNPVTKSLTALVSTGLSNPQGVALDDLGNVYIADSGSHAVKEWNAASQQVSVLVGSGLNTPAAVAVDAQGNVYIADSANNAVLEWNAAGGQVTTLVSALSGPAGVAVDGQANVYIADTGNNALKQWNAATQQATALISSGLNSPAGLAVDGSGNVYLADAGHGTVKELSFAYLALGAAVRNESAAGGADSVTAQVLPPGTPLSATSDQPWLTTTGVAGGTLNFSFATNNSTLSRTGHITVLGPEMTVTQSGDAPAAMTKSAGDGQTTALGQAFATPLQVTVTDANGMPVEGAAVTFSMTPGGRGAGGTFASAPAMPIMTGQNGNATAPVLAANSIPSQFTVTAAVNALTATFTLANLGYTLGTSSATMGSAAGNSTVLLSGYGPWTATSNAPWLHLAAGSGSGFGSALIQFSYSANSNPGAQTGTLTIAGLTFTVTQAGTSYVLVTPVTTLVSSGLNNPRGVAVDGQGNVYIADTGNNAIKEWSPSTHQTVVLASGLNNPRAVAVDRYGNVHMADSGNHAIEEVSAANQQITTLVSGLSNASGVAVDGQGNVYFSDTGNNAIDEWNAASQQVTTLAGSGLSNPTGVAVDGQGNVYFADSGNNTIKEWVAADGQVTALVSSGLNNPTGVAVDGQGNVYTADTGNNAIKQWNAGSQQVAALVSTGLNSPVGMAVDGQGNIYVADTNNSAIKKLTPAYLAFSASSLTEVSQAGTDAVTAQVLPASTPLTATSDQSWLIVTGIAGGVIGFSFQSNTSGVSRAAHIAVLGLEVTVTQSGDVPASLTKCAGDGQSTPPGQSYATALQVCLTDAGGNPVSGWPVTFSVTPGATGASGTLSPNPPMPIQTSQSGSATAPTMTANLIGGTFTVTVSINALSVTFTLTNLVYTLAASSAIAGSTAGSGSVLLLASGPWTTSSNAPWLQVSADSTSGTGNALIQFSYGANPNASAQTGTLTISGLTFTVTQAGVSFTPIGLVTALVSSGLKGPQAVAVDGPGNVYIADTSDNAIKKWSVSTQQVSTLVSSGLNSPTGVAVDSQGKVYIADRKNNAIKEWSVTGSVTSLVSSGLSSPIGVAVDSQGNVYFSDAGHNAIKEWVAASKQVATLVSSGLNYPQGVAVDAQGNVYFADAKNNAIKEWTAAGRQVSTLVSSGLNTPYGVAVDRDGNVYLADTNNNAIKQWSPASRQVTTLVSTGLNAPSGVAVDGQGNVYISDTSHNAIEKFSAAYLSLGATSRNERLQAGTDSIPVQVLPASTPLTATSNQSWLTITGTGGGAIGLSFQANTSVNSRAAQITVSGQAVTVTQSGDAPATIAMTAGNSESTPVGHAFTTALQVRVKDAAGNGVQGVKATFKVVPGPKGAGGTFGSSPPMPIVTNASGYATAPTLTGNSVAGTFTVTASTGTLTTSFNLAITPH